jgi:type II secretory pathway pseudopilin PulG
MTLIELVAAMGLLAAVMMLAAQVLTAMSAERRLNERRQIALQEAANALERLRGVPLGQLTPARLEQVALSPTGAAHLPGGELQAEVIDDTAAPGLKCLVVQIRWRARGGELVAPVRLANWRWEPNP